MEHAPRMQRLMSQITQPTTTRTLLRSSIAAGSIFVLVLALAALPLLWRSLTQLQTLVNFPYPTDQLEGTLLHEARLVQAGEALYQPLETYKFVSAPYTPLHPLVLGLIDRWVQGPHVFWAGRLLSAGSLLLVGAWIVLIVWRVSGSWLAGIVGATLFVSAPPALIWSARIKPDMFVYLWTTLGMLCTTLAIDRDRPRAARFWLGGAVLSFGLAFLAKQTALVAPFAAGLALLIADVRSWAQTRPAARTGYVGRLPIRWRTLAFGTGYLALAVGQWLLLDLITNGNFSAHVSGLHRSEWWTMTLVRKYIWLLAPYWPAALLLLGLWLTIALRLNRSDRALAPACYALVAPVTLMGAAEIGANHNHLLETILALSIAGSCAAGWAARNFVQRRWLTATLLGLAAVQLALAYQPQPYFSGELALVDPPERFLNFIRNTPGEILADDIGLLLQAGKPIRYDDPSTMGPAAVSGVWDQSGLIDDIRNKRFSAIMIPENVIEEPVPYDNIGRWTTDVRAAIREYYEIKFNDRIIVYTPKP